MADYTVDTKMTTTKIKAAIKDEILEVIIEALKDKYGEDNVAFCRVGEKVKNTEKNILAVRAATVDVDGVEVDACAGIEVSGKDFVERKTKSKIFYPFNFDEAAQKYEDWAEKKAEIKAKKAQDE
jgi:hypothetical protein